LSEWNLLYKICMALGLHTRFCILFRWQVLHFRKPVPQADLVDNCNVCCGSFASLQPKFDHKHIALYDGCAMSWNSCVMYSNIISGWVASSCVFAAHWHSGRCHILDVLFPITSEPNKLLLTLILLLRFLVSQNLHHPSWYPHLCWPYLRPLVSSRQLLLEVHISTDYWCFFSFKIFFGSYGEPFSSSPLDRFHCWHLNTFSRALKLSMDVGIYYLKVS